MGHGEAGTGRRGHHRAKVVAKRGHEGIEPSTSPTLKENHTTRPMARAGGACTARGNRGGGWDKTKKMRGLLGVGFEPTPPERLELESSALDHSAIQPQFGSPLLVTTRRRDNQKSRKKTHTKIPWDGFLKLKYAPSGNQTRVWSVAGTYTITVLTALGCIRTRD